MRITLLGMLLGLIALWAVSARAEPQPPPAPPAPPAPKTYVLSADLVNEIFATLTKEPYSSVAVVIMKLQSEAQHQPEPAPVTEEKK